MRIESKAELVPALIGFRARFGLRWTADEAQLYRFPLAGIAVLAVGNKHHTVPLLRQVNKLVSRYFEASDVPGCITVSRTANYPEWSIIRGFLRPGIERDLQLEQTMGQDGEEDASWRRFDPVFAVNLLSGRIPLHIACILILRR